MLVMPGARLVGATVTHAVRGRCHEVDRVRGGAVGGQKAEQSTHSGSSSRHVEYREIGGAGRTRPEVPTGRVCRRRRRTGVSATGPGVAGHPPGPLHTGRTKQPGPGPPVSPARINNSRAIPAPITKGSPGWSTLRSTRCENCGVPRAQNSAQRDVYAPRGSCGTATRTAGKCFPSEQEGVKLARWTAPSEACLICRSKCEATGFGVRAGPRRPAAVGVRCPRRDAFRLAGGSDFRGKRHGSAVDLVGDRRSGRRSPRLDRDLLDHHFPPAQRR